MKSFTSEDHSSPEECVHNNGVKLTKSHQEDNLRSSEKH